MLKASVRQGQAGFRRGRSGRNHCFGQSAGANICRSRLAVISSRPFGYRLMSSRTSSSRQSVEGREKAPILDRVHGTKGGSPSLASALFNLVNNVSAGIAYWIARRSARDGRTDKFNRPRPRPRQMRATGRIRRHHQVASWMCRRGHPTRFYRTARLRKKPNIELMTQTAVVALSGVPTASLERVRWRDHRTGVETEAPIRNVFLFVGAIPRQNGCRAAGSQWTRLAS